MLYWYRPQSHVNINDVKEPGSLVRLAFRGRTSRGEPEVGFLKGTGWVALNLKLLRGTLANQFWSVVWGKNWFQDAQLNRTAETL